VIIASDAASFELDEPTPSINNEKCNNAFVFTVQPLDPAVSDFIAHIKLWNSGSLGSHSRDESHAIGDNLKEYNVMRTASIVPTKTLPRQSG
jgi:hypothetical protein